MAELISIREFARRIGVHHRAVQYAIEHGRITVAEIQKAGKRTRPKIDWQTQEKAWRENTDPDRNVVQSAIQPDRTPPAAPAAPAAPGPDSQGPPQPAAGKKGRKKKEKKAKAPPAGPPPPPSKFQVHRSEKEEWAAKMAEIKYKKAAGLTVELDKVKELFFNIGHATQQGLLNIPARVSAILAAKTDEREIYNILEKEIMIALENLSNADFEKLKD